MNKASRTLGQHMYYIQFNLRPSRYSVLNGGPNVSWHRAVWPILFHRRSHAWAFLETVGNNLFLNKHLPNGQRIISASVEHVRPKRKVRNKC